MNYFKNFRLFLIPLVFLTTKCQFSNFYPDPDDQGLSRFTSRGYNVASTYINERPYRNTGSYYPLCRRILPAAQLIPYSSSGSFIRMIRYLSNLHTETFHSQCRSLNLSIRPVFLLLTGNDF